MIDVGNNDETPEFVPSEMTPLKILHGVSGLETHSDAITPLLDERSKRLPGSKKMTSASGTA